MSPGTGLDVSGGVGGAGAELDDLDHAVTVLHRGAADLEDAVTGLDLGRSLVLGIDGVLADPGSVLALEGELVALRHELQRLAESTEGLSRLVAACATGYRTAEEAERHRWAALGALVGSADPLLVTAGWVVTRNVSAWRRSSPDTGGGAPSAAGTPAGTAAGPPGGPPGGLQLPADPPGPGLSGWLPDSADPQLSRAPGGPVPALPGPALHGPSAPGGPHPGAAQHPDGMTLLGRLVGPGEEPFFGMLAAALVGPAALVAPAAPLLAGRAARAGAAQGIGTSRRTVVVPEPVPPAQAAAGPPAGVGDLFRRIGETAGAPGSALHVRVERTTHADGSRSAVVYLPGTEDWSTGSSNPASLDAILRGVAGDRSAYTDAVLQAVERAGVGADEPVMLAGYSLGGVVAAQMAADPAVRSRVDVQAVVTAGAPIGHVDLPSHVQALALEHTEDLVPALDGIANTALESHQVTVRAPTPGQLGAHALEGYALLGDAVDGSDDVSLTASREATGRFFAGPGSTSVVTEVEARRVSR
ncbi:hypothetical protein FHN55_04590 [Streptomyces sp. NP160]|uniref:hypothetical protein n=1 Tax=Streptomyces sp. NP160 TaxID=2586637 RepID=UPI0011187757|nr:hypothetical protein [Streptomyces sp. NP160]TNM69078.1 hypothetical protein FHN55_04590 [Streptomyces sp. NP160]